MNALRPPRKPASHRAEGLWGQTGSTLVEAMLGTVIASVGIAGLCVANVECLNIAHSHREMLTADRCLQQRADQFRAAGWARITDPAGIGTLLSVPAYNDDALASHAEKITVSAYPAVTPAVAPVTVTRDPSGATSVASQPPAGFILRNSVAVRIDFQETWSSATGRARSRESSTVVAYGGLLPR